MAFTSFAINNKTFIVVASHHNSQGYSFQSLVFKWSGETFIKLQSLQTYGAWDMKSFKINCEIKVIISTSSCFFTSGMVISHLAFICDVRSNLSGCRQLRYTEMSLKVTTHTLLCSTPLKGRSFFI